MVSFCDDFCFVLGVLTFYYLRVVFFSAVFRENQALGFFPFGLCCRVFLRVGVFRLW